MNCTFQRPAGPCDRQAVARSFCRLHFLEQFVHPWQKERTNALTIMAIADENISSLHRELVEGCTAIEAIKAREWAKISRNQLHVTPQGVTNSALSFCHKCWKGFDSGLECINHEAECFSKREKRQAKQAVNSSHVKHEISKQSKKVASIVIEHDDLICDV